MEKPTQKQFQEYYEKNRVVATHIFIFSKTQQIARKNTFLGYTPPILYVNGQEYTEMRSRDSKNQTYVNDAVFVAVGRNEDIKTKKR